MISDLVTASTDVAIALAGIACGLLIPRKSDITVEPVPHKSDITVEPISVRPEDVVVLKVDAPLTGQQISDLRDQLKSTFPKNRAAILQRGVTLGVIPSFAEVEAQIT